MLSSRHKKALVGSIVVAILGYLFFSIWAGWNDVVNATIRIGLSGILFALLMSLVNYFLRFWRWQIYLSTLGHRIPWRPSLKIYLSGFALTTTPGKAGEAIRGVLLKPWKVPYNRSFAAFFSERLSDLIAIVLLTLFGLTLYPKLQPVIYTGVALIAVGFLLLMQHRLAQHLYVVSRSRKYYRFQAFRHLMSLLLEAQRCHRLSTLLLSTLISFVAWSAEAVAMYYLLQWMGADVSLAFAVFVYAVAMLAGALSFMPGGLGGTEAVMVGLLVWKGLSHADAIAITVLIRLATLWFAVAIGCIAILSPSANDLNQPRKNT